MNVVTYGLGRDTDVIGSVVAFGLGILTLTPIPPTYIPIRFINLADSQDRTVTIYCENNE